MGLRRPIDLVFSGACLSLGFWAFLNRYLFCRQEFLNVYRTHNKANVTHELRHVCRRDNLAAVVHMLVEAIFWFYPLVWWLGSRLVDERERACDEEVLLLGSAPQSYAEGILKICEFYLESPVVCAAGVTGSNLKENRGHHVSPGSA